MNIPNRLSKNAIRELSNDEMLSISGGKKFGEILHNVGDVTMSVRNIIVDGALVATTIFVSAFCFKNGIPQDNN